MRKDDLFTHDQPTGPFRFDDRVAEVFDDMLARSVPFYREVLEMTVLLMDEFLCPGDTVYDLGCSTGTTLLALAQRVTETNISLVGVDNSVAMLAKARAKAEQYAGGKRCRFVDHDITTVDLSGAGGVILHYVLQFLAPEQRLAILTRIHDALRPGGLLILSEKTENTDPLLASCFNNFYAAFKRRQGYSDLEISRKREALENVLTPLPLAKNHALLEQAGFASVTPFFQWFNFVSFMAVKAS